MRKSSAISIVGTFALHALLSAQCSILAPQTSPDPLSSLKRTSLPTQTQTPSPTLTAVPASDFELGVVELPRGYILLLSHHTGRACTKECDCPAVEGLPRGYDILDDKLYLNEHGMHPPWEEGSFPAIIYAKGDFEEALVVIDELPFEAEGFLPVMAAFEDGTIVYEWQGDAYLLATDKVWHVSSSSDFGGGCVITHSSSFKNLGLWDETQVEIRR